MDNQTLRKVRIAEIAETIKQAGVELDMDKLVMEICLKYGCSDRTAKEYIKLARFSL